MTTEEILWNAAFENESTPIDNLYDYNEEQAMERYYEDKELFERYAEYFRHAS
ncbi:hypothetical protein [Dysgonomonas macrotermitis]|uniref:Uncharacterized protein n=1 Tax=Dysgonomonas macrotermitis TaxID=1346286 RepID=A0A1M5F7Q3_9BACT|nr:hypothetical protein [Dysgonomonas macrotermitis]SHF87132.1 hypothetical protein SAMN05444362_11168 [Dysgonomonas macrotermitis]